MCAGDRNMAFEKSLNVLKMQEIQTACIEEEGLCFLFCIWIQIKGFFFSFSFSSALIILGQLEEEMSYLKLVIFNFVV